MSPVWGMDLCRSSQALRCDTHPPTPHTPSTNPDPKTHPLNKQIGYVGRSLTDGSGGLGGLPWYGYAAVAAGLGLLGKIVSDAANRAIGEFEESEEGGTGI